MKLLADMNLPPALAETLSAAGHDCVHWAKVGDPAATDAKIFEYAREQGRVILTHDLDFGTLLSHAKTSGPSVVQVRTQDVTVGALTPLLLRVLEDLKTDLDSGALVTVEKDRLRARILPLH